MTMTCSRFATALLVLSSAWACASKAPPPSEAPATGPSAATPPQAETAAATAAALEAPGAAPPAPSAPTEGSGVKESSEPKPVASATHTTTSAPPTSDKSSGHDEAGGYTGDDPCQTKKFHYPALASACHSGGRPAAKGVMRGAVKKAKAAGQDVKCTSCHEDMTSFHLLPNAVADLKKWL